MTIEGLGKKFQEARLARKLTLDEAARMTKIRPSRLAEIEADDFSQFPSLAYAKGFLLIYGKFLDVDVSAYMEAFETSDAVTVDGYSYLQDNPKPKPMRTPVVPRRSVSSSSGKPVSLMPLVLGIVVLVIGFSAMRFILNIQRIAPRRAEPSPAAQASINPPSPAAAQPPMIAAAAPTAQANRSPGAPAPTVPAQANRAPAAPAPTTAAQANRSVAPAVAAQATRSAATSSSSTPPATTSAATSPPVVAAASVSPSPSAPEPEVRRAEPVRPEDLTKAAGATESSGPNRVAIRPLKKTYIKVVVDDEASSPAFERWISPNDGAVEFRGQHISVRVLDRDAVQIKKNGKLVADGDSDVTIE
jgi:cytoskeletal protein RodZ